MQEVAISMDSVSSEVKVPSLREVERKSIMARARRFFESSVDACEWLVGGCGVNLWGGYHYGGWTYT
jgi:hypothetical protein